MDDISIIIRVKNEDRYIGHAIQSCLDHFINPELIIVNNCSTDDSVMISKLFRHDTSLPISPDFSELSIIEISDYSPGKAINLGARHAKRSRLMVLSSHCKIIDLDKQMLFKNVDQYQAVFGKQIPFYCGKRLRAKYIWSHFHEEEEVNMYSNLEDRYFFHNAAACISRDFLLQNPLDEELVGKEDRYWAAEIVRKGHQYLYMPSFVVEHHYTLNGNTWRSVG